MVSKRSTAGGRSSRNGRVTMKAVIAADGSRDWVVGSPTTTKPFATTTPQTWGDTRTTSTTMPLNTLDSEFPPLCTPSTEKPIILSPEEQFWAQQAAVTRQDVESQPVANFEVHQAAPAVESNTNFSSSQDTLVDLSTPTSSIATQSSWPDVSPSPISQTAQQEIWAYTPVPVSPQTVSTESSASASAFAPVAPQILQHGTWAYEPAHATPHSILAKSSASAFAPVVPLAEQPKTWATVTAPVTQKAAPKITKRGPLTKKLPAQSWQTRGGGWDPVPVCTTPELQAWVDPTPVKTDAELLKERVDADCKGWPWNGVPDKLVTLAPYTLNEHPSPRVLKLPRVNQESSIFKKLFNVNDFAFLILRDVFRHHSALWQLSATCQQMFQLISGLIDIWDMTSGYFNNCDKEQLQDESSFDPFHAGSVSAHLVVTPVRRPNGPATYAEQVKNLRLLGLSVLNFGSSLRNVHFHRIPFLNINVLELLIPQMSKLEVLGIYNCQLMHLGTGLRLLDILKVDRLKGKEHSVSLDFYPMYHLGPDNEHYVGRYGVSWDNTQMDTRRGIWSLAKRIIEKARAQNIDLQSPHTMFRQWLEKTPCWKVGWTLNSFWFPDTKAIEVAAMVEYPLTLGFPEQFKNHQCYFITPKWWDRMFYCIECGDNQLGVFFSNGDTPVRRDNQRHLALEKCYGCRLTYVLRREHDHYKTKKRLIIKEWLMDVRFEEDNSGPDPKIKTIREWNRTDLRKAVEVDYYMHVIEKMAADLDELRKSDMTVVSKGNPDPYDRETQERQQPLQPEELRGLTGMGGRAPDVLKEKEFERITCKPAGETRESDKYQWYRRDRYSGHGLHV